MEGVRFVERELRCKEPGKLRNVVGVLFPSGSARQRKSGEMPRSVRSRLSSV